MFALQDHDAKVASFNPRAEKHGEENVPAGDIKFEIAAHSSILDAFHSGYRKFLFRKPGVGEQPGLPFADGDDLTALAQPNLEPLKLKEEFPGYSLKITSNLGFSEPITLGDVELSNFTIKPINGGSVNLSFSATCHPGEDQAGKLCQLIQNACVVTLEPPSKGKAGALQ